MLAEAKCIEPMKDVEHVASMFCFLENLGSVGLIVTSEPRGLLIPGVASEVSKSMYDNFRELLETALAEDEYVDLGSLVALRKSYPENYNGGPQVVTHKISHKRHILPNTGVAVP